MGQEADTTEKQSAAHAIVEIAKNVSKSFFRDTGGSTYAWVKVGSSERPSGRAMQIASREFKAMLASMYYKYSHCIASNETIRSALQILEAEAYENSVALDLKVRYAFDVSMAGKAILIDRADDEATQITISGKDRSVRIYEQNAPLFKRYSHMQPLESAAISGSRSDIESFIHFFNLKDQSDDILLIGFLGASMVAQIPHAILMILGSAGAAKSTLSKALKKIIDPSAVETMSVREREEEMVQQISHHYLSVIDNSSHITKPWQLDLLCKIVTGEAFSKRQLYSDDEDFIFSFKHVLIINGINVPHHRGDLLDRALIIELARVPPDKRRSQSKIDRQIDDMIPRVLRATYNGLAEAIDISEKVEEEVEGRLPRLADFAIWGEAFCRGLGYPANSFFDRFVQKTKEASHISIENDVVADLVMKLMASSPRWEGTSSELLKALRELNDQLQLVPKEQLPGSPRGLSSWLNDLEPNLADEGYRIVRQRNGKDRKVILLREGHDLASFASSSSQTPNDTRGDANDGRDAKTVTQTEQPSQFASRMEGDKMSTKVTNDANDTSSNKLAGTASTSQDLPLIPGFKWLEGGSFGAVLKCERCKTDVTNRVSKAKELAKRHFEVAHAEELGSLETAVQTFKSLQGTSKEPVEDKAFVDALVKTGKFDQSEAEKMLSTLYRGGHIFETRPHFYRKS